MPIEPTHGASLDLAARRVFRLSGTVALALVLAYALRLEIPFIAPMFAFMLGAAPKPPPGLKGLLGLIMVLCLTLGAGLLLLPFLVHYPLTGLLLVLWAFLSAIF